MKFFSRNSLALLALFAVYWPQVHYFWFVCDDAYISFRYGRNFIQGLGLRYNINETPPVEGYSDFLWVMGNALVQALGGNPVIAMPWISALCGFVVLGMLRDALLKLGFSEWVAWWSCALIAAFPPFGMWATSGLEVMPQTLLMFGIFYSFAVYDRPVAAGLFSLGLSLIRTEGPFWALGILGISSALRWKEKKSFLNELRLILLIFLPLWGLYFAARFAYFGDWVSNTTYVKVGLSSASVVRGLQYTGAFFFNLLTPFLVFPAFLISFLDQRRFWGWAAFVVFSVFPVYAILIAGDFMAMYRFMVPGLPFFGLLLAFLLDFPEKRVAQLPSRLYSGAFALLMIILGLIPTFGEHILPKTFLKQFDYLNLEVFVPEVRRWRDMNKTVEEGVAEGKFLRDYVEPGDTAVLGAIGAIGYYSGLEVYDLFGLVSPEVAHLDRRGVRGHMPGHDKEVKPRFFLGKQPTYLVVNGCEGTDAFKKCSRLRKEAEEIRAGDEYIHELIQISDAERGKDAHYLYLYRRLKPKENAKKLLKEYEEMVESLPGSGRHK